MTEIRFLPTDRPGIIAKKLNLLRASISVGGGGPTAWASITGKPSTFTPEAHDQAISTITGLQAALDGKQVAGSYQPLATVLTNTTASFTTAQESKLSGIASGATANSTDVFLLARSNHTGAQAISTITGLQTALDGKQAAGSYASASHSHVTSDVTGLDVALAGKQPLATVLTNTTAAFTTAQETKLSGIATAATANDTDANLKNRANHTGTQPAGTITGLAAVATSGSAADLTGTLAVARFNNGASASSTTFLRGDGTWAVPSSSSDPWTYVKRTSDFVTSSATAVDVTDLAFTPTPNLVYEFEALLLLRTATATVGPRPGLAWATNLADGVADMFMPSSGTAQTMVFGNIGAAMLAAVGGLPNTTSSYIARIAGLIVGAVNTTGTMRIQIASETGGTNVTVKNGSFLKYRVI